MNKQQTRKWLDERPLTDEITWEWSEKLAEALNTLPVGKASFIVNHNWSFAPHGRGQWHLYQHNSADTTTYLVDHNVEWRDETYVEIFSTRDGVVDFLAAQWEDD